MMRRPFDLPPFAVALKAASLLVVAGGLFGIVANDIMRHRADVARIEAPSKGQLIASPHYADAKPR